MKDEAGHQHRGCFWAPAVLPALLLLPIGVSLFRPIVLEGGDWVLAAGVERDVWIYSPIPVATGPGPTTPRRTILWNDRVYEPQGPQYTRSLSLGGWSYTVYCFQGRQVK